MIIFLYGPDAYRRRQKLNEILKTYRAKHSNLNSEVFDLTDSEKEFLRFKDFLNSQSLFQDFKLAVVSGIYEAEPRKDLAGLMKIVLESEKTVVIISEAKEPPKEFDFLVKKPVYPAKGGVYPAKSGVQHQEFRELKGDYFKAFLKKETVSRGLKFSPMAEKWLAEAYEPDTWGLINELEKIASANLNQSIEIKDLKIISDFGIKENIFDLTRTLAMSRPLGDKLVNLEQLFLQKEAAPHIFNLLAVIAPPSLVARLADYDYSIKSGGLDYEEALLDLVI
ncbi:MAG: hypothetical protein HYW34_03655 [Candidatus Brennerbacteria bacterium]|nr:hypothetical protein [Candidatus Brennerbacteria bacterium]